MLGVKWDVSLPAVAEESQVQRWDQWFASVGDDQAKREWEAAKSMYDAPGILENWAHVIELNRLGRSVDRGEETPGAGCPRRA